MKKITLVIIIGLLSLLIFNVSFGYEKEETYDVDNYTKDELYRVILEKNINYKDNKMIEMITNWYSYFNKEEMFLTSDGEYVDYVTYEIYRVHLENFYKDDKKKIIKYLLKYGNFPKEENSEKYDEYINEYKKTTGKDI